MPRLARLVPVALVFAVGWLAGSWFVGESPLLTTQRCQTPLAWALLHAKPRLEPVLHPLVVGAFQLLASTLALVLGTSDDPAER